MSKRVLLVDDSPIIHKMLTKVLHKNGYEICGNAKNGKEGVDMYQSVSPDLVFMDITMPVMDGIEASKLIKESDSNAKIIMLTAMGDDEIVDKANEVGVGIFLKKPFDEYKIISAIAKIV